MSATILAFPRRSPIQVLCRGGDGSAPFTASRCAQHLPLIDAAMDLRKADDDESSYGPLARRCDPTKLGRRFGSTAAASLPRSPYPKYQNDVWLTGPS